MDTNIMRPMSEPTIALLHGFAGSPAAWNAVIESWPTTAPAFVCPALPGHGPAVVARPEDGFEAAAEDIANELPAPPVHLVGYSLGARLALALAVAEPERWASVTLIGVNPGMDIRHRAERDEADERWASLIEQRGLEPFFEAWRAQPLFATQRNLPIAVRQAQADWRRGLDPEQLAAAMRQMSLARMPDYRPRLDRLHMPVQLVVGEQDAKFLRIALSMCARLHDGRIEVVPGIGHNVPLEAPAALARSLSRFQSPLVRR